MIDNQNKILYSIRIFKTNFFLDKFLILELRNIFGIGVTRSLIIFKLLGFRKFNRYS